MKSDCKQLRTSKCKKEYSSRKGGGGGEKGGDSPERIQHKYCPRPDGVDPAARGRVSPTTTWSPFPREKTRPPPRSSPPPLPTTVSPRSSFSYHLHRARPPPSPPSPPLLTGSDRHRHHRGAIAIAAKTNKTKRKVVANVAGGGRSGRKRIRWRVEERL